jgi:hypothetical protein
MPTQTSKSSRGSKSSSSTSSSRKFNNSNGLTGSTGSEFTGAAIPSFASMKEEAIRAFKASAGGSFSQLLPESVADDMGEYAEKAVTWLRKNPGAATAVAVLSGVAVGAIVRQALIGGSAMSSGSSQAFNE